MTAIVLDAQQGLLEVGRHLDPQIADVGVMATIQQDSPPAEPTELLGSETDPVGVEEKEHVLAGRSGPGWP